MKIGLLFIAILTNAMISKNLSAQGLFVKLNAGYSISTNNVGEEFYNVTYNENEYTEELVNRSLSTGLNFGGSVGYMFNKNTGIELGLTYLKSKSSTSLLIDSYYDESGQAEIFSEMLRIAPSFVLIGDMLNLNPYARFGVIIGSGKFTERYSDYYSFGGKKSLNASNEDFDEIYEYEYTGGLAFGFSGSLGVLYGLSEKMSFFGEVNFSNLRYTPENSKIVKATEYGEDVLSEMPVRYKETIFVDKLTYNWNDPYPEDQPSEELKRSYPFGNYGFNLGIRIGF